MREEHQYEKKPVLVRYSIVRAQNPMENPFFETRAETNQLNSFSNKED